jgi:hypothetical protein
LLWLGQCCVMAGEGDEALGLLVDPTYAL